MEHQYIHQFKTKLTRLNWILEGLYLLRKQKLEYKQQLVSQDSAEIARVEIATMERFILSVKRLITKLEG